jgi:acetyl esterase/lipase
VAISPLLDVNSTRKRNHPNAHRCETFPLNALERFTELTLRADDRRGISGQRVCPVDMPLSDMPPSVIQIGSREILMADAELMANRLAAAGIPCDLQVWENQVHVFQVAAAWLPEARRAIDEIALFVQSLADGSIEAPVAARPAKTVARPRVRAAVR